MRTKTAKAKATACNGLAVANVVFVFAMVLVTVMQAWHIYKLEMLRLETRQLIQHSADNK